MDNTRDIFKKRLKALRGERSVNSIAAEIGIAPLTLTRYENGERLPDIDRAADIAKYYGVSLDYLLGVDKEPKSEKEFICNVSDYTGLSEKAITRLHNFLTSEKIIFPDYIRILDIMINDGDLDGLTEYGKAGILSLLWKFLIAEYSVPRIGQSDYIEKAFEADTEDYILFKDQNDRVTLHSIDIIRNSYLPTIQNRLIELRKQIEKEPRPNDEHSDGE